MIIQGDCIEGMKKLEDGSIDLILTDPPYGTIKGIRNSPASKTTGLKENLWDSPISIRDLFESSIRLLRPNGKLILFSQEPYTSQLITKTIPNLSFSYRLVWEKDHFANCLLSKKAPLGYYEDILIFSKDNGATPEYDFEGIHPLRPYFERIIKFIGLSKKKIMNQIGQRADHCFRIDSTQFSLCTEDTYNKIKENFKINEMEGFTDFGILEKIDKKFKLENLGDREKYLKEHNNRFPSIFNLWEGKKFKKNILKYKKDYGGLHPTQKPVELLKDLIKTYSNEGNTILDFTAGSFSTLVACQQTNRKGIGIELEEKYVNIGRDRLKQKVLSNSSPPVRTSEFCSQRGK